MPRYTFKPRFPRPHRVWVDAPDMKTALEMFEHAFRAQEDRSPDDMALYHVTMEDGEDVWGPVADRTTGKVERG